MRRIALITLGAGFLIGLATVAGVLYLEHELSSPGFMAFLQRGCAKEAKRVFLHAGWPPDGVVNGSVAHYSSHYNAHVGRCLMLVAITTNDPRDKETRKSYTVGDAYEQVTYAQYFETALPGFATSVLRCDLTVPKEKPVLCHTAKEWN